MDLTNGPKPLIVRYMPNYERDDRLVAVFHALADHTRVAVVERLGIGPAPVTELARPFAMALPSFMQHLNVLEQAGIVTSRKSGRSRVYQLSPEPLMAASTWVLKQRNHWERRLDQLDAVLLSHQQAETKRKRKAT